MLTVAIMAAISALTFLTFSVVVRSWRDGLALTDNLHHGDFVLAQLEMGLRSAYFPNKKGGSGRHGFQLEDNGTGETASDVISWVKLGGALIGRDSEDKDSPHRVRFFIDDDAGQPAASVRAWRIDAQPDDFDPDQDVEATVISRRVRGLDCRCADPEQTEEERLQDQQIEWVEEWEDTNRLPRYVELSLFLDPLEAGGDPIEVRRVVEIPVAPLSWE